MSKPRVGQLSVLATPLMNQDRSLVFGLDYPNESQALYSNVSHSSGWCYHLTDTVSAVGLSLNGRFQSSAILGYPRVDIARSAKASRPQVLRSGFHCYFNPKEIVPGNNEFTYVVQLTDTDEVVEFTVVLVAGQLRQSVSDVFIDIVGPCNIACAMCPQGGLEGHRGERGSGFMSVELFDQTLMFLQQRGALSDSVNLYNWGDPLLHPDLGAILEVCKEKGVSAIISTNLSFPLQRVHALAKHDVGLLIVSVSGFSSQCYSRNHVRGNIERVKENLLALSEDRGRIKDILLKYLVFRYNEEEIEDAKAFSKAAGFQFGAYTGAVPSAESFVRYSSDEKYRHAVHGYINPSWITPVSTRFCPQQARLTINHRAEVERCCVSWTNPSPISLFETDLKAHLDTKLHNDVCRQCLSVGYSYYKHFAIARPDLLDHATPLQPGQS